MKQAIAIVFSDLHINLWSRFNEGNKRTLNNFRVLSILKNEANKLGVDILFCGDLFHKPENIDSDLMNIMLDQFENLLTVGNIPDIYMISGNHDIKNVSKIGEKPFSWVNMVSKIYTKANCLDYSSYWIGSNIKVWGVPYIDHNIELSDYLNKLPLNKSCKNILLLHTDYPGAKDTDGREVDSVENLNLNTLNKFDLVLCGHIHKPQRLSKKVYMIGSPLQERRTDSKCEMGYWILYDDLSLEFKPLKNFPKFIDVENESDKKDDGNYYTVIPSKTSIQVNNTHKITKQLSKSALARKYMREKGIKDKKKKNLLANILKQSELC